MAGQSADISATRLSASGQTLLFARNAGNFATGLGQCEISHRVLDVEVTRARLAALAYGGWHSLARCRNVPQYARLDREWYLRPFPHRAIKAWTFFGAIAPPRSVAKTCGLDDRFYESGRWNRWFLRDRRSDRNFGNDCTLGLEWCSATERISRSLR